MSQVPSSADCAADRDAATDQNITEAAWHQISIGPNIKRSQHIKRPAITMRALTLK
jgi:hypothetical protein